MSQQSYTVIVTGGAPYAENVTYNTSALIRDAVPTTISRTGHPTIHVVQYPHNVESTYRDVLDKIPNIWARDGSVDAVLHMGMQRRANTFFVETIARSDVYNKSGVDGNPLDEADAKRMWEDCPSQLQVGWNVDIAVERVGQSCPDVNVVASHDAGSFFCELQLYTSLAELYKRAEHARVAFLHVPAGKEAQDVKQGAKVAASLIVAIVDDLEYQGVFSRGHRAHF